ncbi:rab-like protein 3 [Penaeus indicus]|uniref:rab-like protein 3 n=1 Tax=Penaeus indicus TaxID=29960 RepID=UPI00300BFB9F
MANHANAINKVKILVVGDSGVGKSSLVHLICHGQALSNSSWTIGCSVEVRVHEYREGTPSQRPYFVELWDVGGSNSHKNARHVFYNPVHGIILVHDLTNRKSQLNLRRWLSEVLIKEGGGTKARTPLVEEFDAEQFGGFAQVYGVKKVAILCSFFSRFSLSYLALLGAWGICMSTRGKLEFCRWLLLFCFSLVCFPSVKCLEFFDLLYTNITFLLICLFNNVL